MFIELLRFGHAVGNNILLASHFGRVHERIRETESREGASFYALFGPALSLGILSRRRVYYEAIKYEKERNAGFLSPFGYSVSTVAAAVDAVCSMEVLFESTSG